MNIYLLTQTKADDYDTYDSVVVAAPDIESARKIHPSPNWFWGGERWESTSGYTRKQDTWCDDPADVKVTLLGKAVRGTESGVICSSFNAG